MLKLYPIWLHTFSVFLILMGLAATANGQVYFGYQEDHGQSFLQKINRPCYCKDCCQVTTVGMTRKWGSRIGVSPTGEVFGIDGGGFATDDLYKIDTLTGNSTFVMDLHGIPNPKGLIAAGGGIFYTLGGASNLVADMIFLIDVNTNTITNLGELFPNSTSDMCMLDGEIYYASLESGPFMRRFVCRLNLAQPNHSTELAQLPFKIEVIGMSATKICNTVLAVDTNGIDKLVTLNVVDGSITIGCEGTDGLQSIVSRQENKPTTLCNVMDLDCNDSAVQPPYNFRTDSFTCKTPRSRIADSDIVIFQDTLIDEITIQLTNFPDGALEYLEIDGANAAIEASGDGTHQVKLKNGGPATISNFTYMIGRIYYHNDAVYPTPGIRVIEFKFKTLLGSESSVSVTYIPVVELPKYETHFPPDTVICQGDDIYLNAQNSNAYYLWSTGSTSPGIYVSNAGQYSVYINGMLLCANWDTVNVEEVPKVSVELSGDEIYCGDEDPELHIQISSLMDLDITIHTSPADTNFVIYGINSSEYYPVIVLPGQEITYSITHVETESEACLEVDDTEVTIGVFPSYELTVYDTICEGDSVLIGLSYQRIAGIYDNSFYTDAGCDSAVSTILAVTPLPKLFKQSTSCDSAAIGVFITHLPNALGCDTILQTTITFQSSDTIRINAGTCRLVEVGSMDTLSLLNQHGCDSIVITTLVYIPPSDTIQIATTSCDPSQLGIFTALLSDATGCDSLVYTTVTQAPSDTTYLNTSSCNPADVGVFQTLLTNAAGCDSLLVTAVAFSGTDTTFASGTSCNPANVGVFENHFNGSDGCDSTVFTTITFSDHDEVFLQGASCDPSATGVFVSTLVNQLGCDSIVTLTVSLLASNAVAIQSTTCNQASAGVFVHNLVNQFGCDSIVTETITLLPSIQTSFSSTTCRSSDAGIFVNTYPAQNGCDSIVTETVTLIPADTTTFLFKTCDPAQVGNIENTFINIDGCDSLVIASTSLFPLPQLQTAVTSNYHGFGISCFGESDGSINATVNGIPPLTYVWSTGSPDQMLTGLAAGSYAVTVTDGNGCETTSAVAITQPPLLNAAYDVEEPGCVGLSTGTISVAANGGVSPIQYSSNGNSFQTGGVFNNLQDGSYTITVKDANGCTVDESLQVDVPLRVSIDLGGNQVVESGEAVVINAIVSVPADSLLSVVWTGLLNPACPNCLTQTINPLATASYSVTVTSLDGCTAEDAITVFIGKKTDINVANIFSPNGDNTNDQVWITGGVDVTKINSWRIFDRWGNQVFNAEDFLPNDPAFSWDGTWKGKTVHIGVYTYQLIAELKGGKQVIKYGDITLIR